MDKTASLTLSVPIYSIIAKKMHEKRKSRPEIHGFKALCSTPPLTCDIRRDERETALLCAFDILFLMLATTHSLSTPP